MKKSSILALLLIMSANLSAQLTGIELYNEMNSPGFIQYDGQPALPWLPGDMGYLEVEENEDGSIEFYKVNPANEKKSRLFNRRTKSAIINQYNELTESELSTYPFSDFDFVMDDEAIFFTVDGTDFVFELDGRKMRKLIKPEVERAQYTDELMRNMETSQLWNGTYSHDYSKFAHVKGYDLYLVDTATGEETRLTVGSEEQMNGRPSWVYPEEFGERDAYWFSPDDSKIAYLQYNEVEVFQYPVIHELEFETGLELMRYPKAGEENPTLKLFIVDLASGEIEEVPTNSHADNYIVRPVWKNDGSELTFRRFNRQQNHLEFLSYDLSSKSVRTIFEEKEDAYISLHDNFIQLEDGDTFIWTSEVSGFNHIYHYNFDGTLINQLTTGENPVGGIINVDEKKGKVYYTAYSNMGLESHFYVVDMDGSNNKQLTERPGRHSISMNDAAEYYTDLFTGFDHPYEATVHKADGKEIRTLFSTNIEKVVENNLEKPELMIFKSADGKHDLVATIYKPVDFDPNKSYPVVLPLYGGPEYQDVTSTYKNADGYQQLAQLGFIVVRANYRGSGNRGKEFATLHYKKLGTFEIDDYAQVIKEVTKRDYADGNRVGVYGHSYGGYATAMLMLRYPDLFHAGVSGAPVTDWRSYDTIYTERYMDTPQRNKAGYDEGSAMTYADNLKGNLMIIHGTIDNNVHPQNSIMLIDALIRADKDFDVMFYPGNRHGIRGAHGQHYRKIRTRYMVEHLQPEHADAYLEQYAFSN
jgi:dipeptidyl-peptidase-4